MKQKAWGVCRKCYKYAEAPEGFNESKHFIVCGDCEGKELMYLDYMDPKLVMYSPCINPAKLTNQ